jgi:dipeptidyl aminopeptidase/acylaminoacyl peptidase
MAANPSKFLFDWCQFANNTRVVCKIRKYMVMVAGPGSGFGYYLAGRTPDIGFQHRVAAAGKKLHPKIEAIGDRFLVGGYQQWGLKMQDDVLDGLVWMISQGYTDPDRVCIVGASYGGYVASVAAYTTPEKFKCAVSFAGVSDLNDLAQRWRNTGMTGSASRRLQSGSSRDENSPIANVTRISIPLLLVHGDVDRRVMIEQSRRFAAALKKAGKDYIYIEQENGNHLLSLQSHRIEFFEAMDNFLRKHLGG